MKTKINPENFTRIDNDTNGNPRYVCHFLNLVTEKDRETTAQDLYQLRSLYAAAVKRANKAGGRKYHTKSYGGGIVFQSYSIRELCDHLNQLMEAA